MNADAFFTSPAKTNAELFKWMFLLFVLFCCLCLMQQDDVS